MAAEGEVRLRRYTRKEVLESGNLRLALVGGGEVYVCHQREIM